LVNLTLPGISAQGDRIFFESARSLSLGGVSIVLEYTCNPASMGLAKERTLVASGLLAVQNERRGLRVYDSYGNNIGISTVTNNTYTKTNIGPSAFTFPFKMLRVGLNYAPIWDYNYYHYYERRDDFYQLVRLEEHSYRGYVHAVAPLLGLTYKNFSIGFEYGFLSGKWYREDKVVIPQVADSIEQQETQYSGNKFRFGASFNPNFSFRFAYTYQHEYEISDLAFAYPSIHTLAVMYQPAGRIPTRFVGQVEYEMWDRNVLIYKFGVEHMLVGRYALRYGFCVFPDYIQRAIWTTNLTCGFGLNTDRYFFDIGYGYGKRDYLSSDFGTLDVDNNYKFDETTHQLLISTGISF